MGFDVFSLDAANHAQSANKAANANLDASILAIQMIKEMRDWETERFNDLVAGINRRADENQALMREMQDLKAQVAGLQSRLYNEQEKNKAIAR